jgi:2-keto-3-deoxy-L-rhamnonate aldolase RhmA
MGTGSAARAWLAAMISTAASSIEMALSMRFAPAGQRMRRR